MSDRAKKHFDLTGLKKPFILSLLCWSRSPKGCCRSRLAKASAKKQMVFKNQQPISVGVWVKRWYANPGQPGQASRENQMLTRNQSLVHTNESQFRLSRLERGNQDRTIEFDRGSDWTLAACLTHASRTVTRGQPWRRVANGWVIHRNVPGSGG